MNCKYCGKEITGIEFEGLCIDCLEVAADEDTEIIE